MCTGCYACCAPEISIAMHCASQINFNNNNNKRSNYNFTCEAIITWIGDLRNKGWLWLCSALFRIGRQQQPDAAGSQVLRLSAPTGGRLRGGWNGNQDTSSYRLMLPFMWPTGLCTYQSLAMFPLSCARVRAHTGQTFEVHINFPLKNVFCTYFIHVILNIDKCW